MRASSMRRRWPPESVLQRLVEDAVGQREVVRDRRRLRLGRVAAERLEALGEVARTSSSRLAATSGVLVAHRERCLVHAERERAEAAGVEDARAREHLGVARCAGPAAGSRSRPMRSTVPPAGSRSPASTFVRVVLPAPLRPTRPTLSPFDDAERDVRHQHAGAHADLEVVHGEHSECPFRRGRW